MQLFQTRRASLDRWGGRDEGFGEVSDEQVAVDSRSEIDPALAGTGQGQPLALNGHGAAAGPIVGGRLDVALDWADDLLGAAGNRVLIATDAAGEYFGDVIGAVRGRAGARPRTLPRPNISRERIWAWASIPLAMLGVIAGLALLRGESTLPAQSPSPVAESGPADATFIEQPGYSLVLPEGWEQTQAPDGAAFAAESKDGMADATLWIERDPKLSFKQFEQRSLAQLAGIAEQPKVVDRVNAPTIEGQIVELEAASPVGDGVTAPYRVTLRAAGPYRHYFATLQQAGADPQTIADIELMHNSLRPEVELGTPGGGS